MTATDTPNARPRRSFVRGMMRWLGRALRNFVLFLAITWASLVIYFSNLPSPAGRVILAVAFGLFAICCRMDRAPPKMALVAGRRVRGSGDLVRLHSAVQRPALAGRGGASAGRGD